MDGWVDGWMKPFRIHLIPRKIYIQASSTHWVSAKCPGLGPAVVIWTEFLLSRHFGLVKEINKEIRPINKWLRIMINNVKENTSSWKVQGLGQRDEEEKSSWRRDIRGLMGKWAGRAMWRDRRRAPERAKIQRQTWVQWSRSWKEAGRTGAESAGRIDQQTKVKRYRQRLDHQGLGGHQKKFRFYSKHNRTLLEKFKQEKQYD